MKVIREEIQTGLLVVVTLAVLVAVLVYLVSPGTFQEMRYYQVYFTNAGGIQIGAPVMLAGRRVGQVRQLRSPVPEAERPRPDLEAIVQVEVSKDTRIFSNAQVVMLQYGLLAEEVIDFVDGSQAAGIAGPKTQFIGERQPGLNEAAPKVLEKLDPVVKSATATIQELQKTAARLTAMTADGADLSVALTNFKTLTANLVELSGTDGSVRKTITNLEDLTSPESPLAAALRNAQEFTGNLANNKDLPDSLKNFRQASQSINRTAKGLNRTVVRIQPGLNETVHNAAQFSDTIKHQPWRLLWPTTKKYPEDQKQPAPSAVAERTRTAPSASPIKRHHSPADP